MFKGLKIVSFIFTIIALLNSIAVVQAQSNNNFRVGRNQVHFHPNDLPEDHFLRLSALSDTNHLRESVKNILVPRVVGTQGHRQVRNYIVQSLRHLNWTVEIDKFQDNTPIFGKLHFHNIIGKLNPNAERYLTLACHYDSKYFRDIDFLGATDSAIPCAMLLNIAHVLQSHLNTLRNNKLSLMLIFFDGEEAFEEWGPHDSIYGARHLAKVWEENGFIDRLDMLVLLDLIGTPDPKFYSFFANTEEWYALLLDAEVRLSNAGLLQKYASNGVVPHYPNRYFQPNALRSNYVEDDHIPFLRRNVPILHLIPMPFPAVWHTKDDNEHAIDYTTTENISRILRVFVMKYLLGST